MPGGYTGNGSVKWFTDAVKAKGKPKSDDNGNGKYHQEGVDTSPKDGRFYVTIAYPTDPAERNAFRQSLYDAWNSSSNPAVTEVTLDIPVEDAQSKVGQTHTGQGADYQIYVEWS